MVRAIAAAVVDVDDPGTWPPAVFRHAQEFASVLRGTTTYALDLRIPLEAEDAFRSLLRGYLMRAYHATRLLEHEVLAVRDQGLRPLSVELIAERIDAAHAHGYISDDERARLHQAHVFAEGRHKTRAGRVSLFLGRRVLDERVGNINPLLGTWGGEGIYMSRGGDAMRERLQQLGKPTIVVVEVDLSPGLREVEIYPQLEKLFVGRVLGL